jgi:hypothetical protein
MNRQNIDKMMITALSKVKGIVNALPFSNDGLGNVVNTGVRDVLNCKLIYVALTNMDFEWGCHSALIMKKDQELVGEEVRDEERIGELSNRKDVWFMHRNFVVYKDKVSFPQDLMKKICHFEIPVHPAEWCRLEDEDFRCHSIIYANPSALCDIFLKELFFNGRKEKGLGTILVGIRL